MFVSNKSFHLYHHHCRCCTTSVCCLRLRLYSDFSASSDVSQFPRSYVSIPPLFPPPDYVLNNAEVSRWRFLSYYRMLLVVLYYRLDMDFVLLVALLFWAFIIPETCHRRLFLRSFYSCSPSAKLNLFSSCYVYVIIIIWNASIYILHELLANGTNFFAECSGEHHDLFAMRRAAEYFLNIFAHICKD